MKVRLIELIYLTNLVCLILIFTQFSEGYNIRPKAYEGEDTWLMQFVKKLPVRKQTSWRQTENCKCGLTPNRNYTERIVGGVVSKRNAWPWMGAVVFVGDGKPKILCGCSIINKRYLLTASHCAEYLIVHGMDKFQVFLGTNDLNDTDAIVPELDSVIMHPKYNTDTKSYDVALIRLKVPLKFSERLAPICITPQTEAPYYKGKEVIVAGWGSMMFGGVPTTIQMQTMVNITSNKICIEKYLKAEEPIKITPIMMCASAPESDSCQGDSGGPLFLKRKRKSSSMPDVFEQIGIVSFGSGCADNAFPGVYTRIGKVLNWIKSVTNDAIYCDTS